MTLEECLEEAGNAALKEIFFLMKWNSVALTVTRKWNGKIHQMAPYIFAFNLNLIFSEITRDICGQIIAI